MKIAVCISGQIRTWEKVKQNNIENVIKNADIFYFTNADLNIKHVRGTFSEEKQNFYTQEECDFFASRKRSETNVDRCLNMYYKIFKCNELKKQFETENNFKYDVVVRLRTDTFFNTEVNFEIRENCLFLPEGKDWGGICDQFAYGSSSVMDHYSDLFPHIKRHVQQGCIFHPETLLKYHCNKKQLQYPRLAENTFHILRK